MENASKALIIAGAILLAIVIISLGLIVVNNTRGTVDSANMSEQEIQTFNAKFTPYEGSGISGTRVKTLMQTVIASNQANSEKTVSVSGTLNGAACNTPADVSANVSTGKTYTVTLVYTNGLVSSITIS